MNFNLRVQSGTIIPVILAGGGGTRLWPVSRTLFPKQFGALAGDLSLLQETCRRVGGPFYRPPLIVGNEEHRFLIGDQVASIGVAASIVLEPAGRNTAAAIACAALIVAADDPDAVLHVLPADHRIVTDDRYWTALDAAAGAARAGGLVTFGIEPTCPATGYGYIRAGAALADGAFAVERFVEKPDAVRASGMLSEGGYFWNSGMFMFTARRVLEEIERHVPDIAAAAASAVAAARRDLGFIRLDAAAFLASPSISIDYAVLERTSAAVVVPSAFSWSDLGSWESVHEIMEKDGDGNAVHGPASTVDAHNSLIYSTGAHVALLGVDNVAVVATDDAVLVADLSRTEEVKAVVARIGGGASEKLVRIHSTAYRPWGGYAVLCGGEGFQVKRLFVNPGKQLSLQSHHHRAEHWVVVRGTAEVTVDGTVRLVSENESVYIPLGARHRLANPGRILLELIEVQSGRYLGEDDIVRYQDDFGRA
jgi:mannose-1-phosphate guanylyltransferase